jgi:hypothetical protein
MSAPLVGENRVMTVPQLDAEFVRPVMGAQFLDPQQRPESGDLKVGEWFHRATSNR